MIVYLLISVTLGLGMGIFLERRVISRRLDTFGPTTQAGKDVREQARAAVRERGERRLQLIMTVAAESEDGRITNDEVEELFCISDRTASNYLRQLTAAGRLQRHGSGRGTYYTVV